MYTCAFRSGTILDMTKRYINDCRMPLVYNGDGSLDLYFQTASPGDDKENNWLPTPEEKGWNLTLRLYAPERRALNGSWIPPPAVKE